jgi:hypothetical protein
MVGLGQKKDNNLGSVNVWLKNVDTATLCPLETKTAAVE